MSCSLVFGHPHPAVAEVAGISLLFCSDFLQHVLDRMREYFFKKWCWEMEPLALSILVTSTSAMGSRDHLKSAVSWVRNRRQFFFLFFFFYSQNIYCPEAVILQKLEHVFSTNHRNWSWSNWDTCVLWTEQVICSKSHYQFCTSICLAEWFHLHHSSEGLNTAVKG